jgi:hypothetical protein
VIVVVAAIIAAARVVLLQAPAVDPVPPGWKVMVKHPPVKLFVPADGSGVCLDARSASFSINRKADVDLRTNPVMTWTWRADVLPARGDFRQNSTDDQAAQLFVVFERRGLGARHAINYIWDTNAAVGDRLDFTVPFLITVKTVVVKGGTADAGRWVTMRRDLARDHRELFGESAAAVEAVRFQVNSQHTSSRAVGCLRELWFSP